MGRPQADPNAASPEPSQVPRYPPENPVPDYQQQKSPAPYPTQAAHFPPQPQPQAEPFPPQLQPSTAPFPPQPQSQVAPFPPQAQPQVAAFPPSAQPYANQPAYKPQPVNYPPAGPQQFNQNVSPAHGIPYQQQYRQAPVAAYGAFVGTTPWTTGLFDCMDDPTNAVITTFFPCVTFGQVAEILDSGHTPCATSGLMYGALAFCFVPCILSCTYRTKLRVKYDLMELPAQDLITHFLCECCALCQEYRELRNRGLDPGIGWHANMMLQAQQQQVAMTPPMHQTMNA